MENVRNIFCIGRNYRLHAEELGNALPISPLLFSKPTHALVLANGQAVDLPGGLGVVHHELELVIHVSRPYREGMRVEEVVDQIALGIDFTLRDVQNDLKQKGHPWLLAKGFRHSALLTAFHAFPGMEECRKTDFSLLKNGETVQRGNISEMIFDLPTILAYTQRHFGLDKGDVIYTGTPAGVGPVAEGDHLALFWGKEIWGECTITLHH